MPNKTIRILLGFCADDQNLAEQIAKDLKDQGHQSVILITQYRDILHLQRIIQQSDVLLLLILPNATQDDTFNKIITIGQQQRKYIIPLLSNTSTIPFELNTLQYIDLTFNYSDGIRQILQAIQVYEKGCNRFKAIWRLAQTQHPFLTNFLFVFLITVLISSSSLFFYFHVSALMSASVHFPHHPQGYIQEYALPQGNTTACAITAGKDNYLWFIESNGNYIGRISAIDGSITEFSANIGDCWQPHMALDSHGNLWYIEYYGHQISRISPDGVAMDFSSSDDIYSFLQTLVIGVDGNVWFTSSQGYGGNDNQNKVGFMTPSGRYTSVLIPTQNSYPFDIIQGSNQDLWFSEPDTNIIGHITNLKQISQSGTITEYSLGSRQGNYAGVDYLAIGADHNIWFSSYDGYIGAINPHGKLIAKYKLPALYSRAGEIICGPDGNLWAISSNGALSQTVLIKITTAGKMSIISIDKGFALKSIITGPDGNIWFSGGNVVGFITP